MKVTAVVAVRMLRDCSVVHSMKIWGMPDLEIILWKLKSVYRKHHCLV